VQLLTESLRKHGIDDRITSSAIAETQLKRA
jgi:predicted GNAT family acetyltransferase